MPKTNYCKSQAEIQTEKVYTWLMGNGNARELGELLGVTRGVMHYKLKHRSIRVDELIKLLHELEADKRDIIHLLMY